MTDAEYQFELGRAYDKGYREAEALFMSMCSRDGVCGCHRWWHYPSRGELPPKWGFYLVTLEYSDKRFVTLASWHELERKWHGFNGDWYNPVAWMPLPEPPKEEA